MMILTKDFLLKEKDVSFSGVANSFDMSRIIQEKDNFEIYFSGFIEIETSGEYFFHATFNDALKMYVGDRLLINRPKLDWGGTGSQCIYLEKGKVPFKIQVYDRIGMEYLKIEYDGPGIPRQEVPSNILFLNKS